MRKFHVEDQIFVFDKGPWKAACEKNYCLPDPPTVTELENGIILPLRKRTDIKEALTEGSFEGGVCNKDGNFVAGHCRKYAKNSEKPLYNLSCLKGYKVEKIEHHRHETVIFGGVLFWHFGHLITECMTRLWWFAEHQDTPYKIVFLDLPVFGGFKAYNILEAMGITRDRMEIITEPTRFDKIIVPEESLYLWAGYRPGAEKIYQVFQSRVKPGPYPKVYLSRTQLSKKDGVNEEYFENFYRKRGFKIIYPEQLPFEEQISILYGADEVVCTMGTLSSMLLFCKDGIKVTILIRMDSIQSFAFCSLQLKNMDYSFVEANFNFLPTEHSGQNIFFYGPTVHWKNYLDRKGIPYKPDEVSIDIHVKPMMYEYVTRWAENYAKPFAFRRIHNQDLIDVLNCVHKVFFNTTVNRKDYAEKDELVRLRNENASLKNKAAVLDNTIQAALAEAKKLENTDLINQSKLVHEKAILEDTVKSALTQAIQTSKACAEKMADVVNANGANILVVSDNEEIRKLEAEVKRWRDQVRGMEDSLSWRITKPLRTCKAWIKKRFR